jgi:hypothetical protein
MGEESLTQLNEYGEIHDPKEVSKSVLRKKLEGWQAMGRWTVNYIRDGLYHRHDSAYATKKRDELIESVKRARPVRVDSQGNITYKD